jgi:Fe(3+) dicitrate transport protein
MQVINSNVVIDPSLEDEKGFNIDLGLRGRVWDAVEFDFSLFYLNYSNRIGYVQKYYNVDTAPSPDLVYKSYRLSTNIGDSKTLGLESYIGWDVLSTFSSVENQKLNVFLNTSVQNGTYVSSKEKSIEGNQVELNPDLNVKCGVQYQYKALTGSVLFSHTSSQFSDAQNTLIPTPNALFGEIPAYSVVDLSTKYEKGKFTLEAGVNNVLNESYFTRRATGYPGPGIIPSDQRNYYLSIQVKL